MIVFDSEFTLHSLREAADLLGLSLSKVQQAVRSGSLAAVHHGGRWMVAGEEVERYRTVYRPPTRTRYTGVPRAFTPPPRPGNSRGEG